MDLKKLSHSRKRKKGDTSQLAAQLAPLEEQPKRIASQYLGSGASSNNAVADPGFSAIVVDNESLSFPKEIREEGGEKCIFGNGARCAGNFDRNACVYRIHRLADFADASEVA